MDLEKLKNAGKALPNDEHVKQIIARFPNEKDEFTNTLHSLTMVPCTKELFGENGVHAISKAYNFGVMLSLMKKPNEVYYIDTGKAYYYILNETEKTITQKPIYGEAQARYYKTTPARDVIQNDEYIALSDTVTFKSTTLSVSDEDIEEFKKYATKHRKYGLNLVSDKYNEYAVFRELLDKIYKPFVDNIPEKIITTYHNYMSDKSNSTYFCYYTIYLEGNSLGMSLLAQDELEGKQDEIFGGLNSKQVTATVLSTFANRNLGDDIENLLYEFFTENPQAKNEPEFNLTLGVYFDEEDDGDLDDVITSKFEGLNLIVNTQPIKVVGAISQKDYLGKEFSPFYNWNLFEIKIPEVTIPVSQNVIDYYVKKRLNFVHWSSSSSVLGRFLYERMYEVIKPKLLENKIKVTSGYYFHADIFNKDLNCQSVTLTIKNPIFSEDD